MFATLQAQSEVYKPGNGVTLPVVVKEVKPEYTREAMQQKIQGSVWLQCVVSENGRRHGRRRSPGRSTREYRPRSGRD